MQSYSLLFVLVVAPRARMRNCKLLWVLQINRLLVATGHLHGVLGCTGQILCFLSRLKLLMVAFSPQAQAQASTQVLQALWIQQQPRQQ